MIRASSGPVAFFNDAGRARWHAAGSPSLEHGPSIDLFAPDCLGGSRNRRRRLQHNPGGLDAALSDYTKHLHDTQELLGEGVVKPGLCRAAYHAAARLLDVEEIAETTDELGRSGRGLAEIHGGHRTELIFAVDLSELLGYRHVLSEPSSFAPAGALHSWSSYLERKIVDELPPGTPPVPKLPCEHGAGRGFHIRPGFSVTTGYVTDPVAQLTALRDQRVITDAEYQSALTYQAPRPAAGPDE